MSVRKRPLAPWAVMLAIGTFVGSETTFGEYLWPLTVSLCAAVIIIGSLRRYLRKRWWGDSLLIGAFALFIMSVGALRGYDGRAYFITEESRCEIEGEITHITKRDTSRVSVAVRAYAINGKDARDIKGLVNLNCRGINQSNATDGDNTHGLKCGMRLRIYGRFTTPPSDIFGDFDYMEYLKSQGLGFLVRADSATIEGRAVDIASISGMAHDFFISSLERVGVSHESQVFLQALVLGDKSELPRDVRQAFTDCGTGHVLAVSGLHVGILSMAVMYIMGLFCGGRTSGVITLCVIWVYALLVGMAPSIVRSSIMFSFLTLESVLGRRLPSFHSLWAALFFILLADPSSVTSAGLWLSFAAVGGILAATPVLRPFVERQRKPIKWLCGCLSISVVAQIATLPIMLYCFNSFPTYFWINNLVVLEPIRWVFIGAVICPLVSWIPLLGNGLGWVIDECLALVIGYCEWAASLPMATIGCTAFGMAEAVTLSFVIVIAFYAFRKRDRHWLSALCFLLICFISVLIINEMRRESGICLFSSNGETGIVLSEDRHNSVSYVSDTTNNSAIKAVRHIEKKRRWTEKEIRSLGRGIIISTRDQRIAVVNTDYIDTLPICDIYLINCNLAPEIALNHNARYIIGPKCEIAAAWKRETSLSVTIMKRQDEIEIK